MGGENERRGGKCEREKARHKSGATRIRNEGDRGSEKDRGLSDRTQDFETSGLLN